VQAKDQFMLHFAAIKVKLDASDSDAAVEIMPVRAALLKQNLTIGIDECRSMGFAGKSGIHRCGCVCFQDS
jgi:hypothetical protein